MGGDGAFGSAPMAADEASKQSEQRTRQRVFIVGVRPFYTASRGIQAAASARVACVIGRTQNVPLCPPPIVNPRRFALPRRSDFIDRTAMGLKYVPTIKDQKAGQRYQQKQQVQ